MVVGKIYNQEPAWQDWIRCLADDGREAWVPIQFLNITEQSGTLLKEYDALELSLTVDDVIRVSDIVNGFGMAHKHNGEQGWVPMNHLEIYKSNGSGF